MLKPTLKFVFVILSCSLMLTPSKESSLTSTNSLPTREAPPDPRANPQKIPASFDDEILQPPSTYDPHADHTVIRARRSRELDTKLIELLTDPATLMIREEPIGSNWGPDVRRYLEYCGIHEGAWWCAAFVSYQIHQASSDANVFSSWPAMANCDDIYRWAKRHKLILKSPAVPSVMLIPGGNGKLYKHTGIVVAYDPSTRKVTTVEGNSNNNGSSNGIGVFKLQRSVKGRTFIRIV